MRSESFNVKWRRIRPSQRQSLLRLIKTVDRITGLSGFHLDNPVTTSRRLQLFTISVRTVATFCRNSMYALAWYVSRCDRQTVAAKKVNNTSLARRVPSRARIDLHAISIAHRTAEQNQRRIQGQPSTRINPCREPNEQRLEALAVT